MITSQASLEIGFWGNLNNTRYQIIGAGVWQMDYLEYYSSSDGKGYEQSYWTYTEWVLRDVEGNIAYLVEDKEGFSFSNTFEARNKTIPKAEKDQFIDFNSQDPNYRIIEFGTANLQTFEGENGYDTPDNPKKYFFIYEDSGIKYSLEIPLNTQDKYIIDEREYYAARSLRYSEVLSAFEDNPKIKEAKESQENLKFATSLARILAWTMFVLFCYSFFSYQLVYKHSFDLKDGITDDSTGLPTKLDTLVEFFTPDTWQIKKANEVYLIETEAFLGSMIAGKNPCEMFVQTAIIDEEAGVVNQMAGDFWEEYGRDSDGPWRESSRYTSMYVRSEKPAKYSAWVAVERTRDMLPWTARIEVRVYKYQFLWWYMMIYWFLALGLRGILGSYTKS